MGHRKYSAPRRGSMAFYPRVRARSLESRIRSWADPKLEKSSLLGFAGYKVTNLNVLSVDDREKTPNFGKNVMNSSTLIATPPLKIIGVRAYTETTYGRNAVFDAFAKDSDKFLSKKAPFKFKEGKLEEINSHIDKIKHVVAVVSSYPNSASLSQKKPFVWEIPIGGKDTKSKIDYVVNNFGKQVNIKDVFEAGQFIDISAITRGKGVEGPITRFGVKRKQHKSRKSVRALGTLGPISPAVVTYTVPRQGQRGFHQRTEYNKRILIISNSDKDSDFKINPKGGFEHYGLVKNDYIIVKGSVAGVPKRLIKMRFPIRAISKKVIEPKVLEVLVK
ncbi:MAG: 50S ribosomal protein L3 [Nitrososphaeraceae archaeon]|jgi:large subunit ribosomal protein L3|nr:50S ribosomal protein L3 [Nitrososphaeraceae archaeon]MDW0134848.1 50S ribosomal protein L3 [Nitrososphaeraceae archaeon]MDW0154884.1 50S ribosomal protein L3 [Nitrososphaeraceae archaeon]